MQKFLALDLWLRVVSRCCGQVLSVVVLIFVDNHQINDVMQKIEKTLNNTHTTKQKQTNNGFHNTKKHRGWGMRDKSLSQFV